VGHAAPEVFLVLNGYELEAPVDDQERVILVVAAGEMSRKEFSAWVNGHVAERTADRRK
jgi:death-on-curing protein